VSIFLTTNTSSMYAESINRFLLTISNIILLYPNSTLRYCTIDLGCKEQSEILSMFREPNQYSWSNSGKILIEIPGVSHGCLAVNTILLSTFEFFYGQTCVNKFVSFFHTTGNSTAMPILEDSQFKSNPTMKTIVDYFIV
jgi:hypothetical protein